MINYTEEINKVYDTYNYKQTLGSGNIAEVVLAEKDGELFALKLIDPFEFAKVSDYKEILYQELKDVKHPNLMNVYEILDIGMICEFCEGTSLQKVIDSYAESPSLEGVQNALKILWSIFPAIEFLQEKRLAHGDITPKNIIQGKLIDLDSLNKYGHTSKFISSFSCDEFARSEYDKTTDLRNLGRVLCYILDPNSKEKVIATRDELYIDNPGYEEEKFKEIKDFAIKLLIPEYCSELEMSEVKSEYKRIFGF